MGTVVLTICKDAIEASFIQAKLESAEIECFITNENMSTIAPFHFMTDNSGVKIFVHEEDLEEAKQLL